MGWIRDGSGTKGYDKVYWTKITSTGYSQFCFSTSLSHQTDIGPNSAHPVLALRRSESHPLVRIRTVCSSHFGK